MASLLKHDSHKVAAGLENAEALFDARFQSRVRFMLFFCFLNPFHNHVVTAVTLPRQVLLPIAEAYWQLLQAFTREFVTLGLLRHRILHRSTVTAHLSA